MIIASPPKRKSKDLINVATSYFDIDKSRINKCQLPDAIPTKRSFLQRPEKWQKQIKGVN
jgi:hypothetical protein